MSTPKWAQELAIDALIYLESKGLEAEIPTINWRRGQRLNSSGYTNYSDNKITVTAGTNRTDQKLVLLHELAHVATKSPHTAHFWDVAWNLYQWAKLPIRYCQSREYSYKAGARVAYRRNRSKRQ